MVPSVSVGRQVGSKPPELVAVNDIKVGKLKLAAFSDLLGVDKAKPHMINVNRLYANQSAVHGRERITSIDVGSTMFVHKDIAYNVFIKGRAFVSKDARSSSASPSPSFPFWCAQVDKHEGSCTLEATTVRLPGSDTCGVIVMVNERDIKKGDPITVKNVFAPPMEEKKDEDDDGAEGEATGGSTMPPSRGRGAGRGAGPAAAGRKRPLTAPSGRGSKRR